MISRESAGRDIQKKLQLLSLLYTGIGNVELERLLRCLAEHLEFHFWYLTEKGWIRKTENGTFAITVEGVDRANSEPEHNTTSNLLTDQRSG